MAKAVVGPHLKGIDNYPSAGDMVAAVVGPHLKGIDNYNQRFHKEFDAVVGPHLKGIDNRMNSNLSASKEK